MGSIDVIGMGLIEGEFLEVDHFRFGSEFDLSRPGHRPFLNDHVHTANKRIEIVKVDLFKGEPRLYSEIRLGQEIGVAVDHHFPRFEDRSFQINRGGILIFFRFHIDDVLGPKIDILDLNLFERTLIDVGKITVDHLEFADFQRINSFGCFSKASVFYRYLICRFLFFLR